MDDQTGSASPKADWYPDPVGGHQLRYWDGLTWTDSVADGGQTSTDPLPQAPLSVAARLSGICEGCQAQSSLLTRLFFFVGTRGSTQVIVRRARTSYSVARRSQVVLCEKCFKVAKKRQVAINRAMTGSGSGSDTYWTELPREFVLEWLKNTTYARIRDLMQDDLATPMSADGATVVFHWKGRGHAIDGPVCVAVDGVVDGWGSFRRGFSAPVRVPPGTHTLYAKCGVVSAKDLGRNVLAVAPDAEYAAEISASAWAQTLLEITRTK
jgi:hypothetical protein